MNDFFRCSWCGSRHSVTQSGCAVCGHEGLKPKALCGCENCIALNGDWESLVTLEDLEDDDSAFLILDDILDHL